jgi:hypothetical protein
MRSWIRKLFTRPVTRPIRRAQRRTRLDLETLEDRCCPSTFTVTNTEDAPAQTGTVTTAFSPAQFTSSAFKGSDASSLIGQTLTFTSGADNGKSETITSFNSVTGTFTFATPFSSAFQAGDSFTVDPAILGSLRWAVSLANANPGPDTINFAFNTRQTINLGGSQLELSDKTGETTIAGPTQSGTITAPINSTQFASSAFIGSTDNFFGQTLTFTSGNSTGLSDTIVGFDGTTGTFTLANPIPFFSPLQAGDSFTVNPGAGVTISGGGLSRVFQVDSQVAASFSGLTITEGAAAAGGGVYNLGTVVMTNCTLSSNSATSIGGGLDNAGAQSQAFLTNCTISGNSAASDAATITTVISPIQFTSSALIGSPDNFIGKTLTFTSGNNENATQLVTDFDKTTGTFTFATAFPSAFQPGDAFTVSGAAQGPAQTGSVTVLSPTQFTSSALIGSTANFIGQSLTFTSGADNGKSATVQSFDPTTGTFTFANAFPSAFQAGDTFTIDPALATAAGGGLANSGLAVLTNCTVSANTAANLGGGLLSTGTQQANQIVLANTIVAGNTAPAAPDVSGTVDSLGSNLIGKTDGSSGWVPAFKETVTTAGSATQFASSALAGNPDNFIGQTLTFTSGANTGKFGTVTNFDPTTGTFTLAQAVAQTGTITTVSSTTKFTSSAFINSTGNFFGQTLTFTSGANKNATQLVTDFDKTTGTFTFATAFSSPFQAGDAFTVDSPPQVGDAFTVDATTALTGTVVNPLDPKLGPLTDNGGPTPTMALQTGSPAINAGNTALAVYPFDPMQGPLAGTPLTTDQRGVARVGPVDIGAFESSVQAQTILISGLPPVATFGQDFQISATAVDPESGIATGLPVSFTATGDATVTQVGNSNLWQVHLTGVGTATITAHQAGDTDFSAAPNVTQTLIIAPGIATITPTPYTSATTTYDGTAHTATATATGVGGVDLSKDLNFSTTTHTNPGSYTDTWTFHDPTGTYRDASGTITDSIGKANATVVVTPYTVTYDGTPHTATLVSITGVPGVPGQTGAAVGTVDLSTTTHTNVGPNTGGAYNDSYSFTGTAFYNNATFTITDTIGQAQATITPTPYTSATTTYDGTAHTATATATGVGGVPLVTSIGGSITTVGSPIQFTSSAFIGSTDKFIGDVLTFTSGDNNNASGTVQNFDPTTGTFTFANAFSSPFQAGDTFTVSALNFSSTTHTNAGTYTDTWTFHDLSGNYQDASDQITDSIAQASALILVTPYNVAFDGNPHTATIAVAVGVGGVDLRSDVDLRGTTHTAPGFYPDTWTFHDASGNYQDATGTVDDSIAQTTLTAQPTAWMGQLADGLPLTDVSLPGTYNSASGPNVADALLGDSSAGVVGAPSALSYTASSLHLTAALVDAAAEKAGGDNTALNGIAIGANAAATAADAAAGITDTVSGLGMVSDTAGLTSGIADAVQAHLDSKAAAANTAATAVNNPVADPAGETTAAKTADGAAETANLEAETANQTALGAEGAAESANGESILADEAAKDSDQVAADQGDVDPAADETAAGLDEAAVGEDSAAAALDQTAVADDLAADAKDTETLTKDAANGEAATANAAATAEETAAEAPDAAAATNNQEAAFSAGASSVANFAASGADGATAGEFTSYANEINPATSTAIGANAAEQATLYGLAVTEASAHSAASALEFAAGTADAKAAAADFKASSADAAAVTAATEAAAANTEATAADTAAEEKDADALAMNAVAETADGNAEAEDAKAAGLDEAAGTLDAAAGEADSEAAAADAEAATLDAEALAADAAAPIADAAAVAADGAAATASAVAVSADIVAAAQAGLDPVADGIAVAADATAAGLDATAAGLDAAAVAADAAVVADDAAALTADGEAAAEDAKAGIEDGLAVAADEAATAEDTIAEGVDAKAVAADTDAVAADEAATAADSFAEEKDAEAVTADTEATTECEQANEANVAATEASEAADAANNKATVAGAAATAADIAFMTEVGKVQSIESSAITQNSSIPDQLNAGVRSLDLRGTLVNDTINLNDGQYFTGTTLQDALDDMTSFLQQNPTETLVVNLSSNENPGGPVNSVNSFNTDLNNLLNQNDTAVSGSHTYNDFMYYSSNPTTTPTLGQVRGKIVIVPAAGDPWTPTPNPTTGQTLGWTPTQVVQDSPTVSEPAARWNLAENNGGTNTAGLIPTDIGSQNTLYRTNLSVTGNTSNPTVDLGTTVNSIADQALTSFHVTRTTGIVGMDNPDPNVISAIINQNNLPIMVTSDSDAPAQAGSIATVLSTTQFTSSAFKGSTANFIGEPLTFTSGADNGHSATVTNFDPTTGTFTLATAFSSAFKAGDAFTVAPTTAGTLRAAIVLANSQPGVDTIEFAPSLTGPSGQTIVLLSDLPAITGDVNIVGPATIVTQNHQALQHAATHTVTEEDFVASDSGPLTKTPQLDTAPIFVNTSNLTTYVTVTQQQAVLLTGQINSLVSTGVLNGGNGNALTAKLNSAAASFASGNPNPGINKLTAFINQVNDFANSGKPKLTAAEAQTLITTANEIIALANPLQLSVGTNNSIPLQLSAGNPTITAGTPFNLTVTAIDVYGNVLSTYTDTVKFTDSVTGATLPAKYTFTTGSGKDNGVHTFTGLVLNTKGPQTLTVTDSKNGQLLGSLTVNVV